MSFFNFIYIDILYPSTARVWTGDTVIYDNNKPNCNFFYCTSRSENYSL